MNRSSVEPRKHSAASKRGVHRFFDWTVPIDDSFRYNERFSLETAGLVLETILMDLKSEDTWRLVALVPPFAIRLLQDGMETGTQRLLLLAVAVGLSFGWAALFAGIAGRPLSPGLTYYAMGFVLLLPGPVAWIAAGLALSFGAVFGREVFGGRTVLPPAAIGLAFAILSFPEGGFAVQGILATEPNPLFAISCLPGAAILFWRDAFSWESAVGAVVGTMATGILMEAPWTQPALGAFAAGVVFLAAAPEGAPERKGARWLHGLLVGALVVLIRVADPDQPDGVVFAALLAGLFAPLLDRAVAWRPRHA